MRDKEENKVFKKKRKKLAQLSMKKIMNKLTSTYAHLSETLYTMKTN